jgi:hypothetical protein
MGILEISENIYLQVFLLPCTEQYLPLWVAFSEGAVGGFFLHGADEDDDTGTIGAVRAFIEGELKKPLVVREIADSKHSAGQGTDMFRELFSRILDGQADNEMIRQ